MSRAAFLVIPFLVAFCLCAGCSTGTDSSPESGFLTGQSTCYNHRGNAHTGIKR